VWPGEDVREGSVKRLNIKDAFVGEPSGVDDGSEEAGDEAVVLAVRGGEVVAVVPSGTPDERVLEGPSIVRGALRLENERVLSFEIHDGATGAFFEDESAELHRRRRETGSVGLSSIEGPDYMAAGRKRARDVMTTTIISTSPDTSVNELSRMLAYHNVSGLPVLDEGSQLVGIVSEADVIAKRGQAVDDIMTREIISVQEDDSLESIAHLMAQHRIKRVLVRRGQDLVGLVSRADIVKALAGA
jgi:CBS domain-containing protein